MPKAFGVDALDAKIQRASFLRRLDARLDETKISDKVLFGDVWRDPALSPRDRSIVTITSLVALYRHNELEGHIKRGLDNGLTKDAFIAAITHFVFLRRLAYRDDWPAGPKRRPQFAVAINADRLR